VVLGLRGAGERSVVLGMGDEGRSTGVEVSAHVHDGRCSGTDVAGLGSGIDVAFKGCWSSTGVAGLSGDGGVAV